MQNPETKEVIVFLTKNITCTGYRKRENWTKKELLFQKKTRSSAKTEFLKMIIVRRDYIRETER